MNTTEVVKHEIYNKLSGLSEKELALIADFVDFMRHQKKNKSKKLLKLQGIIKEYDIDFDNLKRFKKETWQHVDQELADE